jgi:hypothetical protein
MTVLGARASRSFSAEPDIKAWADHVALNPSGLPAGYAPNDALDRAAKRLAGSSGPGLARLSELAGLDR